MIAHVAQAGENRGCVVVRLGEPARSSSAVLSAAVHLARAFQAEIEGLFIEDPDVVNACAHPFCHDISLTGERKGRLSTTAVGRDTALLSIAMQRELADRATASGVPFEARAVRDTVVSALQTACSQRGPWNIVAFAEPIRAARSDILDDALSAVWGATGFLAAGPGAIWRRGPVLVAVDDVDRLPGMVRAAERIAAVDGVDVFVMPVGPDDIALDWLEGEIRLTLPETANLRCLPRSQHPGSPSVLRAEVCAHEPSLIIARNGGQLLGLGHLPRALADLARPVFIVH
jgi:hypothetical protein